MLSKFDCHTTIPVTDINRAKKFYKETLGLTPMFETAQIAAYQCGSAWFNIFLAADAVINSERTIMAWEVDDVRKVVDELTKSGVVLIDEEGTVDGIRDYGNFQGAAFLDSEGNRLGMHSTPDDSLSI